MASLYILRAINIFLSAIVIALMTYAVATKISLSFFYLQLAVAVVSGGLLALSILVGKKTNLLLTIISIGLIISSELLYRGPVQAGESPADWIYPRPYYMFNAPSSSVLEMWGAMGGSAVERRTIFNEDGFRIESPILIPKPQNELRIFMVGGSALVMGAPIQKTIPAIVEARLHMRGLSQAKVYNFGIVAAVSGQELALITHKLLRLQPDIIVVYDGYNDLGGPINFDPRPGYPYNFMSLEIALERMKDQNNGKRPASDVFVELLKTSAIVRAVSKSSLMSYAGPDIQHLRESVHYFSDGWRRKIADNYIENLQVMCASALGSKVQFIHYFQPTIYFSKQFPKRAMELSGGEKYINYMRHAREDVLSGMKKLERSFNVNQCSFNDISNVLENNPEYFVDQVHISHDGNKIMGDKIADNVLARLPLEFGHKLK